MSSKPKESPGEEQVNDAVSKKQEQVTYEVLLLPTFKREAKRLSKKYPSLKAELGALFNELETNPTMGIPLGDNFYKIRLAISSKGVGKSGGARVMTYLKISQQSVLVFSIFSKGEKDSMSEKEMEGLIKNYK